MCAVVERRFGRREQGRCLERRRDRGQVLGLTSRVQPQQARRVKLLLALSRRRSGFWSVKGNAKFC